MGQPTRATLQPLLTRLHAALGPYRDEVDELNVFPVPDGDTGTNMLATLRSALDAVADAPPEADDEERCRLAVRGAMRGARGNSGVILSQVIRALCEAISQAGELDGARLSTALCRARDLAYEAVSEPVEGTILTAIAAAAGAAPAAATDLGTATRQVALAVHAAVERTPDQLQVLREAGVVDAGARGLALILDGLHAFVTGEQLDDPLPAPLVARERSPVATRESGSLEFRFEVQYLLDADEDHAPDLRRALSTLGDSVVVVGSAGLLSVHVHTNDVGPAIEAGLTWGRPSRIEVVAFDDQIEQAARPRQSSSEREAGQASRDGTSKQAPDGVETADRAGLGCVAVLPPGGLADLARELGAGVVPGTGGSLPSVADLLNAVGEVDAARVVLLPGHRNAVPTARQAARVSVAEGGRHLDVIDEATDPTAILAALALFLPDAGATTVIDQMRAAAAGVRAGEIVAAVRDADTPIGAVREGQWLAVVGGEVVGVDDDPVAALRLALTRIAGDGCEVVTISIGAEVDGDERDRALDAVRVSVDGADLEILDGGQRPARYLVGCE